MGDAGKKVNQLCEEMGIPPQNPEISAMPNQQYQKKEKTSQYKGVYWHREKNRCAVLIYLKGQIRKYGGNFKDELDAAKGVNQLCQKLGIPPRNPEISAIPNQQHKKRRKNIKIQRSDLAQRKWKMVCSYIPERKKAKVWWQF